MAPLKDSSRFDDRDAVVGPWGNRGARRAGGAAKGEPERLGAQHGDRLAGAERSVFVWMLGISLLSGPLVLIAVGTPWKGVLALSGLLVAMVAGGLWAVMATIWRPWARRFPARPLGADATVRFFGSASLGRFGGCNNCLEVAADEACVHLRLMPPFSWVRPERISVPREQIVDAGRTSRFGELAWTRVGGRHLALPAWTLAPRPPRGSRESLRGDPRG